MIIEQLELLCIRNKEKISNVLKKIGVSPSNAQRWRNGEKMNTETLIKLADYFNVSTDYILGREEKKNIPNNIDQSVKDSIVEHNNPIVSNETKENKEISLNDTQRAIVTATNGLDDEQQARVLLYIYQLKKETV